MLIRRDGVRRSSSRRGGHPPPGVGDVLVRVRGSSVNPVDAGMRAGMLRAFVRLRMPAVFGVDVAGAVAELGGGVTGLAVGDRVFAYTGLTRPGGGGAGMVQFAPAWWPAWPDE
jgi:NADPH:quinone reductase-like Zn-dependent oxidoreductase